MDSKIERITAVASHNEHLIFETPLIIPDSLMFVFDYLLYHSSIQMQKEIYKAIDELFLSIE